MENFWGNCRKNQFVILCYKVAAWCDFKILKGHCCRIKMSFNTVNDPAYNSMLHTYDGTFEPSYVSGYESRTNDEGVYIKPVLKVELAKTKHGI